jgi:hypothetical protein
MFIVIILLRLILIRVVKVGIYYVLFIMKKIVIFINWGM